jgi:hypothetical protein
MADDLRDEDGCPVDFLLPKDTRREMRFRSDLSMKTEILSFSQKMVGKATVLLLLFLALGCNLTSSGQPVTASPPTPTAPETNADPAVTAVPDSPTQQQPTPTATAWPYKDLTERPQIWFSPLDPYSLNQHIPGGGPFQFYDLFQQNAPWMTATQAVHVMRLYPVWLETEATPVQLQTVLDNLKQRRIAITFENGPLTETALCNAATLEGFSGIPPALNIAQRIAEAGGVLYAMDLEHGFDAGTFYDLEACHMTPAEIAQDTANYVNAVRGIFPNAKVGSIETADLDVRAVADWMSAYKQATGQELDYFHLDINFFRPDWAERAKAIEDYVKSRGVDFGIIYFGDHNDSTDQEWLDHAESRFVEYEVLTGGRPDHVIFQSWHPHPQTLLPDNQPGTFTNLILRYLRPRTNLTLERIDDLHVTGTLLDEFGSAMPGVPLEIRAQPLSGEGLFAEYTISGNVPDGATHADTGFRINMECDCNGTAALTLEQITYLDSGQTVNGVPNGAFGNGLNGWGIWGSGAYQIVGSANGTGGALSINVTANQDLGINSGTINVTPGSPFTLTFLAKINPASAGSGYFDIIFLNSSGEVSRQTIPIEAGQVTIANTTTDINGRYETSHAELTVASFILTAWYPGSDTHWPALAQTTIE